MSQTTTGDMSRIQIENVEDWSRIQKNFTEAILSSLSQCHAASGIQEALEAHLLQWKDNTFQLARLNIRVNGRNLEDYSEDHEDTEPFNEILDRRIWSLNAERMTWDKELGDQRRKIPLEMERVVEDALLNGPFSPDEGDEQIVNVDTPGKDYSETTTKVLFGGTAEIMESLEQKAPMVLERTKRARIIAEEILGLSA